ncbi:MAG: phosphonate ABC transporter ATP-binding protein [Armatimonadota bacterium]
MVSFDRVGVTYPGGHVALRDFTADFHAGEFVVVVGLSGAGKSTLVRCVNRLVAPTSGSLDVLGESLIGLPDARLRRLRGRIGMIFQSHNLVRRSTVMRNVLAGRVARLPVWRSALGWFPEADTAIARTCLAQVGIAEKAWDRADTLSGGQQQRVAIARALAQQPSILLADEPVASLDPPTAHQVMRDLKALAREHNLLTLVNLHFVDMAMEYADRVIGLRAGEKVYDGPGATMRESDFEAIYGRRIRPDDLRGRDEAQ